MGRRRHRVDVALRRERKQDEARARETQLAQEVAHREAWERRRRRKVLAYVLFALALIVVVTHILEHAGVFQLFSPGLEDVLVGYPTAFVLVVMGAIALGTEE